MKNLTLIIFTISLILNSPFSYSLEKNFKVGMVTDVGGVNDQSLNPFSLVELFKNIIGVKASKFTSIKISKTNDSNAIVIHPFASLERKAWKPEKWVEILLRFLKEESTSHIYLVGSQTDLLKSQIITQNPLLKNFSDRISNLTGKIQLTELHELLSEAKLFVGHDSMVGHLASVCKTTSLTISLGSVRPHETTPYQINAYNISPRTKCYPCFPTDKCEFNQCHHDISFQMISSTIKELYLNNEINDKWLKENVSSFHTSSINFYKSRFENGRMAIENISQGTLDSDDIFRQIYKIVWSYCLSETEVISNFPKLTPISHRALLDTLEGVQNLFETSEFGKKYSRFILEEISSQTPSVVKIKDYSKKIDEIDQLQKMVVKTSPYLAPLIDYFVIRKSNIPGENIVTMAENLYLTFEEYATISSVIYDLVEKTISEHVLISERINHKSESL